MTNCTNQKRLGDSCPNDDVTTVWRGHFVVFGATPPVGAGMTARVLVFMSFRLYPAAAGGMPQRSGSIGGIF